MFSFLKKKLKGPVVYKRPEHCISRKNIDSDALKVLYRLSSLGYTAYLVGGGQENNFRSGTEGTPAIFGFAAACGVDVNNINEDTNETEEY